MTKLSLAQKALAAFNEREELCRYFNEGDDWVRHCLAAALEAVADQVVPDEPAPTGMRPAGDVYSAREIRRGQRQGTRSQLLTIAAELRGTTTTQETP